MGCVILCPFQMLSHIRLFETPWTVAYQSSPFTGFSRQEYRSGLPFPSPGSFLTQGLKPGLPHCRQTLYSLSHQGSLITSWQIDGEEMETVIDYFLGLQNYCGW